MSKPVHKVHNRTYVTKTAKTRQDRSTSHEWAQDLTNKHAIRSTVKHVNLTVNQVRGSSGIKWNQWGKNRTSKQLKTTKQTAPTIELSTRSFL